MLRRHNLRVTTIGLLLAMAGMAFADDGLPDQAAPPDDVRSVAVLDFRVIGEDLDQAIGEALPAVIRSALVRNGSSERIRVIERAELTALLTEQDLQLTDIVDQASAVQAGRIAGVDHLVLGSVARVGGTYTVTSRVVDVATGEAADAEEFTLQSLDYYPQLGRLIAALIGEQPLAEDSIAKPARLTESFDGPNCRLTVDPHKDPANGTSLDGGRYVMKKSSQGNHYWWVPEVNGDFYLQVDLAQLDGPAAGGYGLVWGARGTGDYLSVRLDGQRGVRLERRQGGTTTTTLHQEHDWPVIHVPPHSNRIRLESWGDRHRVFVNGHCVDDIHEPGYRDGQVGLRVFAPAGGAVARYAADNLTAGVLDPSAAGIGGAPIVADARRKPVQSAGKRPKIVPRKTARPRPAASSPAPSATIARVWLTREKVKKSEGIEIHMDLDVRNLKGAKLRAVAYFQHAETGQPLRDRDGLFKTGGGLVAAGRALSPRHRKSAFTDFSIFIPTEQLHLRDGRTKLKCHVVLWDEGKTPRKKLARSTEVNFAVSR